MSLIFKTEKINFQREKATRIQVIMPEFCSFYQNSLSSLHLAL